ncbi:MAG: hypothetical protein ACE5JX_04305 [Acidobacteriota bacterium]
MSTVWMTFIVTAVVLALGAWSAMRFGRPTAVFRTVAGFLLAMALGTAVFPALLPVVGVTAWVAGYVGFVAVATALITVSAVRKAQRTAH